MLDSIKNKALVIASSICIVAIYIICMLLSDLKTQKEETSRQYNNFRTMSDSSKYFKDKYGSIVLEKGTLELTSKEFKESKNKEILEEIINKYGKPKKYGSIFKLQKAKENFEQHVDEKLDWLRDRVKMDLEKIVQQEEIMTFFKTQSVMEKLKEDDEELSLIDFYADIVAYGNYLGKDLSYCDIIDLALEYRNR